MNNDEHREVIDRLESLERSFIDYNGQLAIIGADVDIIKKCIVGEIKRDRPGLSERMRTMERWIEGRKWLERLMITVLVANLVGLIFVLIQSNIFP